jgi:hypothetical protein
MFVDKAEFDLTIVAQIQKAEIFEKVRKNERKININVCALWANEERVCPFS